MRLACLKRLAKKWRLSSRSFEYGPMSAEATVVRNYLDWMTAIPWKKASRVNKDIKKAREILDADHFGLMKLRIELLSFWLFKSGQEIKDLSCALLARQGWAKPHWGNQLPAHRA